MSTKGRTRTMIRKLKFYIPEYQEKLIIFETLGYEELEYQEKGIKCKVTFNIPGDKQRVRRLRQIERLYMRKGPSFIPIILMALLSFVLLSLFVIFLAIAIKDGKPFDLNANAVGYLLPAFFFLALDTVYTAIYFKIHNLILHQEKPSIEDLKRLVESI